MHTHQQAGLRIATCGLLVLAFAASAEDGIATGAAQAPVLVLESPAPELPVVAVSELGHAVAVDRLSALRGGDGSQTENLIDVDDRGIQALLREVPGELLQKALKGADDQLKEKVFKNMSKRAAEMLGEDLAAMGPVRVSDVEAAQKEILSIARRLADAGEIMLGSGGGDDFV